MARADKRLRKMRQNPHDWRIEEIQIVADNLGIAWMHETAEAMSSFAVPWAST